ncbi:abnormal spindle-like microcephaly-associated protein [Sorex araneus]|uniref:abnormal spindle-like microcephaly-associated protein n=1 Tax=Sorex araneus TaxID=42254 RepID=UPI00243369FC|nr:abnormal spindle-like microcephaly-associated protein [Sorex araneus]
MATRPGGRSCWELGPGEPRLPPAGRPEPASPAVLSLSHFCRSPFLCFGELRPGASRTLSLTLDNPNEEVAEVQVCRFPAAERGFSISQRRFVLQPKEKIVVSVNWTPLEEGRVREIITFLVNDVLKHQAILLGNAEEKKKKKRSLWDTISKKKVSTSSNHNKKHSNIHSINKTFDVSQQVGRVRSPLQACENLAGNEGRSPAENNSLVLEVNKVPVSPISPTFKNSRGDTGLPLSARPDAIFTSLHALENEKHLEVESASVLKDFSFSEKIVAETSFNSISNMNNLNGEDGTRTRVTNYSSTLNVTQTQRHFLSPDSFVNNICAANNDLGLITCLSSDTFMKDNARPGHLESNSVHNVCRAILSPDSFIKDSCGINLDLESESIPPILSPNQFLKDNIMYLRSSPKTCTFSAGSVENSDPGENVHVFGDESKYPRNILQPPPDLRKSEALPCVPEYQDPESPKIMFKKTEATEFKSANHHSTKLKQPKLLAAQDVSSHSHDKQLKRRPILCSTVTKKKPVCAEESQMGTNKPRAKRCLNGPVEESNNVRDHQEKDAFLLNLPVIDPLVSKSRHYKNATTPPSGMASVVRKRKSEGNMKNATVRATITGLTEVQEPKRIHFSPAPSKTSTVKKPRKVTTPLSKRVSNREKFSVKKKSDSSVYRTPHSKTSRRSKSVIAVAQSTLTFIKPLKTGIPRHPMPFAAKNMFYDERWKEKQEQGFTWWLNFILTPDDFTVKTSVSEVNATTLLLGVENQHKISVPRAPTKEEVSLRAYTARCRLNKLRRAACRLFMSEKMVKAIKKLEIEIEARRLMVRKDRHLWKDVGERQKVLNWLLSYNPLWLRIGLETVFGELISLEDNSDVTGLAVFILNRLLWNPDIAAEYRHPSVPHLYGDGHEEALSKFTLKKLLLLVCFLDHAKISRLIDHDPCLFCKDAKFKASKEILLAFSRDFLSGEGDLSRHLSLLGLPVNHVQTPFDEFDFAVSNLAVDLQCGVRLVRAMELLTQDWTLSKKLRMPAISHLQKMHNVDIVLHILRSRGISLNDERGNTILAKDIVDRHREKTLALLWKIAFAFQVEITLNVDQLKEEINFLSHTLSIKKAISALSCHSDAVVDKKKEKRKSSSFEQYSENIKLLMDWVNAVCAFYNKKVENFTVAFSDGRVLCYLIHHYHPCYVPFDAICQRTTQTVECTQSGSVVLNLSSESDGSSLDMSFNALDEENTSEFYKELLENEKKNFKLVRSAVRDLGGIPAMIHHSDMSNTIPDEKVVITYLSFLCARLLDLRKETRAARLIQTAWRKYKLKTDLKRYQERDKAARIIQSAVIKFLTKQRLKRKVNAALTIQKYWRRYLAQRELLILKKEKLEKIQNKSASVIQRYWRRYSARKKFLKLRYYSIIVQSRIRMIIAVNSYKRYLWATVTVQRRWRACLRRNRDQQRYKMLKASALVIQSVFRRWKQRKLQLEMKAATVLQRAFRKWRARKRAQERSAVVIQSWYRMHKELRKYNHVRSCVVIIQARFRCYQAQKLYKRKKESVLTIQRYYKAYVTGKTERASYLQKRTAAIQLQTAFRRMKARALRRQSRAACVLQSYWRMRQDRARYLNLKKSVIILQAHVRMHQQFQKYKKMKHAALILQLHFRAYVSAKKALASYQKTRSAAIVLQSAFRGLQARKKFRYILTCITKIQSSFRAHSSRKKFLSLKKAAIKLQSVVKMKQARKRYLNLRRSVLLIQRWYRATKVAILQREEYLKLRKSCVKLQALVRGYLVRKQLRLQRKAAISLQSYFRMRKTRQYYLKIYKATLVIQNYYHAYKAQVNQRKNFLQIKRAVISLQAAYRGYRVRQLIKHQSAAALTIQSAFRGYSKRVKYQSLRQSTIKIQRWYRACKTVHKIKAQFLKVRAAVISLQSAYRGWRVRKQIRREHQAAVKIQSAFRMAKAQKQYRLLKTAALVIQQRLRAWALGKKQRAEYLALQHAVLVLQSTWRGKRVRRQIQKERECAVTIQAHYRMYVQQKKWKTIKRGARVIQMYYRTYCIGKKQRHLYLKTRAAAVVLQSAYRSMRVRKEIKEWTNAAVTIQARYRAYKTRKKYASFRASAIAIQRWYRNIKIADYQRKEYLNLKMAATRLQAVYRGFRVRRHIQHMHLAATVIQAMFKMHQSKMRYQKLRTAAVVIQVRYRAYYEGKSQRAKYLTILKAVCVLQASFRGARVRQTLRKMQVAATLIQANYRRYRQQTQFNNLKKATKTVQQWYRAIKERNRQFQRYSKLRHSVICIQAAYRGMKARRCLKVMHLAAALIQGRFRTQMMRRRFLSLRETTIWIQRKYRANVCARYHMQQFLHLRRAVITIQAWYRGWLVRKKMQEMSRAARLIQAAFRMHTARVRYQTLQHASIVIQQRYRANRATKLQRHRYLQERHSALILQAAFRGMRTRRLLKTMHFSVTLIQSRFRSLVMRKRFISLKKATIFIQRKYRATICAKHHLHQFLELRKAAIIIQSSYRGLQVRKMVQEKHRAALLIQAAFRMHRTYVTFQTWRHAAILIQQRYRAHRAAKLQRESYIRQRRSAVVIQAAYKGMRTRRLVREMRRAAIIIQSTYRMYRQYSYYQDIQWATKVIQKKYRANQIQKALGRNALEKSACIPADLQDGALRPQMQEEHHAAIIVQKYFRAYRTRKRYLHFRAAVVFVQRRYRAYAALRTRATNCTQSSRGFQGDVQHLHRAATLIQSFYRRHRAKVDYQAKKTAVVIIQRYYRSYVKVRMEREQYLAAQKSVGTLQTAGRGESAGQKWQRLPEGEMSGSANPPALCCGSAGAQEAGQSSKAAAHHRGSGNASLVAHSGEAENPPQGTAAVTTPQTLPARDAALETQMGATRRLQCFLHVVVQRRRFERQKRAAVTLQRYFRMWQARKQFLLYRKAAVVLQTHFRAFLSAKHQRNAYLQLRSSIIIIQAWTKGHLQKRKFQKIKIQRHQAACLIQARFRGYKERQAFLQQKSAAITIQRYMRAREAGRHARINYVKLKYSTVILQALVRGWLVRKRILEQQAKIKLLRFTAAAFYHLSAFKIQRAFKLYLAVKNAKKHIDSVIYIQRWFRARLQQKRLIEKYRNILKIEQEARERLRQQNQAASVIQRSVRRFLLQKKQEKVNNGIKKIQALWRGYAVRKKNDCKKIKAIRLSLQAVNREIREENKLYKRTELALHYLLTYKHISAIIEALKHLEVVTRLSPLCCENMAQSGAISKLFVLIRSCNRSVPCMEVIRYSVQVLLNIAKYEKTTSAIYAAENCMDTLLDLLQMYREKPGERASDRGGSIFTKTCCLLAVLLKTTNRASDVRSRGKVVDRIYSVYKLTARKHKMNMERILVKQKNSSLSISFIPETPVRTRIVSRLKPYWVLRRDKVEEITNPLQAIQMVMDTLGIPYQ